MRPEYFSGRQVSSSSGSSNTSGASLMTVAGVMPCSSAAEYTKGLKAEPGWRVACTTRLNLLRKKSKPPTSASTAPSSGRRLTSAPSTWGNWVKRGDIVRLLFDGKGQARFTQLPQVEGALVSLRPDDGAVLALVGGFDFFRSKFNRVVQATRQPGSAFKPFVYSAALEHGMTPATVINDAPVVFDDPELEETWRPENYSGRFYGPTRRREALVQSRNLVAIRVLRAIGISDALEYVAQFGFDTQVSGGADPA